MTPMFAPAPLSPLRACAMVASLSFFMTSHVQHIHERFHSRPLDQARPIAEDVAYRRATLSISRCALRASRHQRSNLPCEPLDDLPSLVGYGDSKDRFEQVIAFLERRHDVAASQAFDKRPLGLQSRFGQPIEPDLSRLTGLGDRILSENGQHARCAEAGAISCTYLVAVGRPAASRTADAHAVVAQVFDAQCQERNRRIRTEVIARVA